MNQLRRKHSDYWLSLAVFLLVLFGIVMIYSVTKYYSLNLTNGATDRLILNKQFLMVVLGAIAWIVCQAIDYRFWQKHAGKMLFITIGLLILPIILKPISPAGRWINLGSFSFQPSELGKLTFMIYLSGWLAKYGENLKQIAKVFLPYILVVGLVVLLMFIQKDLGTMAIYIAIAAGILVAAGAPIYQIFFSAVGVTFIGWLAIKIEPYRLSRLATFLNPASGDPAASYHIKNALIAVGSGGVWGLGFGQSRQKYLYLPEAHTDSIFAIICEELGLLRASVIILVFVFIAWRGVKISQNAPDVFSRLLAFGITIWIFVQMAINVASMISLVPMTGVPLPFISYGGSSLIVLLGAIGILCNISKYQVNQ